jgi:hypothetical protein
MAAEQPPQFGVVITNKDLYVEIRKLQDTVLLMTPQADKLREHDIRISQLERWRYALPGSLLVSAAAIIAAVLEGTHHGG